MAPCQFPAVSGQETHTKPIRVPKTWPQEHTSGNEKTKEENARNRCTATVPGANTKQGTTKEKRAGKNW